MFEKRYTKADIENLPSGRFPCVYVLFGEGNEILYVGKSERIRERMKAHFFNKSSNTAHFREEMKEFSIIETFYNKGLEMYLIKKLNPKHNIERHESQVLNEIFYEKILKDKSHAMNSYNLKSKLGQFLKRAGIKQSQLADMLGVSKQLVNAWVAGRSFPSLGIALVIAKFLECSLEDIWVFEEEPSRGLGIL